MEIFLELHVTGNYLGCLLRFLFSVLTRHPNCAIDDKIPINTPTRNAKLLELHMWVWMRYCRSAWDVYENESPSKNWKYYVDMYRSDSIQLLGGHWWNIIHEALCKRSIYYFNYCKQPYIAHCLSLYIYLRINELT